MTPEEQGRSPEDWREVQRRARELEREAERLRVEEQRRKAGARRSEERRHGREACRLRPLYRSREGRLFGVCKGFADYLEFPVTWLRILTVLAAIFLGIWPVVIAYIVAALVMKPEPVVPFQEDSEQEFYNSYVSSRSMALSRLKRTYDNLERRIRRIETMVTARDYDWERRLNERS
jgi:phage shock protein C